MRLRLSQLSDQKCTHKQMCTAGKEETTNCNLRLYLITFHLIKQKKKKHTSRHLTSIKNLSTELMGDKKQKVIAFTKKKKTSETTVQCIENHAVPSN